MSTSQFQIPRLRAMARHALPNVVEGTIVPVAVFLVGLHLLGVWGAMTLGLAWCYGAVLVRLVRRQRVPGILLLAALTLTARTVIAFASGSVFVYFLQPSLGTALVACAFLASVSVGRPLAERLAHDFLPLPADLLADSRVRRFFLRISLLWAFAQFANAAVTIWLLLTQSVATFVLARTATSVLLTGAGIAVSVVWFRRSMTRHGLLAPARAEPSR